MYGWPRPLRRARLSMLGWLACALLPLLAPQPASASDAQSCVQQLVFNPASGGFLPVNNFGTEQAFLNCFGWQLFIAMNWPVNPGWPANPALAGEPDPNSSAAHFGVPSTPGQPMSNVPVWASYKDASDIFLPGATKPSGWGVQTLVPSNCTASNTLKAFSSGARKFITATSESAINRAHRFHLSSGTQVTLPDSIMEASGGWLTDQAGNLVFFERKVGKAEFDYIVDNGLYDAANQLIVAQNSDNRHPAGLSLPAGKLVRELPTNALPQEELGALELKAAWRVLTNQPQLYGRYLTTVAWLQRPDTLKCTQEVVGLVGLHIINKTQTQPNFIWTTFEQVDNVPDAGDTPPPQGYTFNNPACTGDACTPNVARVQCDATHTPPNCTPLEQPVQATRANALPQDMQALNAAVQQTFAQQTQGQSVFQYYKLVNVLWSKTPNAPNEPGPGPNVKTPLSYGPYVSDQSVPVANTTLETYVQNDNCNDCHQYAAIAGKSNLASDFSFLFGNADSAKNTRLIKRIEGFKTLKDDH